MLSRRQLILLGVIGGGAVLLFILVFSGLRPGERRGEIVMWGVADPEEAYGASFESFRRQSGLTVKYFQKNPDTYEAELINALAAGLGPDVFMIGNSWVPKHFDKIQPAPRALFSVKTIEEFYPQVVVNDFTSGDNVWAVPLSVDTLALFYNRDLLDQAGIPFPPATWEDLAGMVTKLVKADDRGGLRRQAVALGLAKNVDQAADILALLMMQSGAKMVDSESWQAELGEPARNALDFFIQFARPTSRFYTWNADLPPSLDAFAAGSLALTFNYASRLSLIQAKAPKLNFGIAVMPQPVGSGSRLDYANYWGLTVARASKDQEAGWQLIAFLTDAPQAGEYLKNPGRPPARRDLIRELQNDRQLGVFARQALTAESWIQPDPAAVAAIFTKMIESVASGSRTSAEAVAEAEDRLNLLLTKFRQ